MATPLLKTGYELSMDQPLHYIPVLERDGRPEPVARTVVRYLEGMYNRSPRLTSLD